MPGDWYRLDQHLGMLNRCHGLSQSWHGELFRVQHNTRTEIPRVSFVSFSSFLPRVQYAMLLI